MLTATDVRGDVNIPSIKTANVFNWFIVASRNYVLF